MANEQLVSPDPRPWFVRLIQRSFPRTALPVPDGDLPGFAPAYMKVITEVRLDWLDRLRILVSGKCAVETRIYTDVPVNHSMSEACFTVLPP